MSKCPKCGGLILVMYGDGWDWDRELCSNIECTYENELDVSTCTEPDGSIYIMDKPGEDDE